MQLGQTIQKIRKENHLTQEEFAEIFHVTRQTVSNWENEKSYPDLLTLVAISDNFHAGFIYFVKVVLNIGIIQAICNILRKIPFVRRYVSGVTCSLIIRNFCRIHFTQC